jgi:hypothetical protein
MPGVGAAQAYINTLTFPSYICSNDNRDNSYWVMVASTSNQGYAQAGWFVEGTAGYPVTPHVFVEVATSTGYDPGAYVYNQISNVSGHTYQIQIYKDTTRCSVSPDYGAVAGWFDGLVVGYQCVDWWTPNNVQITGEFHVKGNRMGTVDFGNTQYCLQPSPGTACGSSKTLSVQSSENLSPAFSYGCYWQKNTNDFEIYDARANNPPSC